MYSKNKRICPCCGKPLELIPPTEKLLPNRYGISENNIPFYLVSDPRYIPYTLYPHTLSEFNSSVLFEDIKIGKNGLHNRGMFSANMGFKNKHRYKIVTVYKTQKMLRKNLLLSVRTYAIVFFCRNCEKKLALNTYPSAIFDSTILFGAFALVIPLIYLSITQYIQLLYLAIISVAFCVSMRIISLLICLYVKLFMSNFVATDLRDNMIIPKAELNISRKGLKRIFLHRSNVYETELDGEMFCLYLTEKGKYDLKLHICGIEGEPERLLALIREKQERGEKVTLPLTFEGKYVGTAEVLRNE